MAIAWSRISSKVIAHPPYVDAACRRRCGNGTGRSGAFIPHRVGKRKQEVLGVHDAEVTPPSQTHTKSRGALCPQGTETPKNRPKSDSVATATLRSASPVTAAPDGNQELVPGRKLHCRDHIGHVNTAYNEP